MKPGKIPVTDPFGIAADAKMTFLGSALNPIEVQPRLSECATNPMGQPRLCAIRVVRYKPERRCLIEYDVQWERARASTPPSTLLGKVRAKGLDKKTFRMQQALWQAGFGHDSADGISVPEPFGVIPQFQMWLQWKVPGVAATELFLESRGVALARRVAEAAHKLHRCGVPSHRLHTMADEMGILRERLEQVAEEHPEWRSRLSRLVEACERLGVTVAGPALRGIHRDFYPAQVLVDEERLWLVDFDMYSQGDPALDVGNFLGHLTEQSLRVCGDPAALADREQALAERFFELAGPSTRDAVRAYTTFTVARHIYLSMLFPDRRSCTEPLLEWCEQRLY